MSAQAPFASVLAVCSDAGAGQTGDDGDAATLRLAGALAERADARLTALAPVPAPGARVFNLARDPQALRGDLEKQARARLEAAVAEVLPGRRVDLQVRIGKPFLETVHAVIADGHDLVVKAAEELDGVARHLLASTDQHLLRKCPATVWMHRPRGSERPRRILAAVDVDPDPLGEPDTEAALNRRILAQAAALADWAHAPLDVLSCWEAPEESLVRAWGHGAGAENYPESVESRQWTQLDGLLTAAGLRDGWPRLSRHVERGNPRQKIPEMVGRLGADLLVLGTVARTGVPGLIIGNTAEDVLNSVDVGVVAVKPPGYVSPIQGG
jgi:nucleotide-binding universal stress UspA family protein